MRLVFPGCTSPLRKRTIHCLARSFFLDFDPKKVDEFVIELTSSIYEWRMVATALIMLSTFGLEMVDPMYILFMVDDFLISISSSSLEFILFGEN